MVTTSFLEDCIAVLSRTPQALDVQLRNLPDGWLRATEGEGTWSPYDVVGHLIHGERADWMVRLETILTNGERRAFQPFDREAQFRDSAGKEIGTLLDEFAALRGRNLARLEELNLQPAQLQLLGAHPAFGAVTLRQLLATWTAHDLAHLTQVNRVMAKRYRHEVGPWAEYLSVMR